MGKAMLTIMAAFAQLERDTMIERTRAGLAAAAANERKGGRPRKVDHATATKARSLRDKGIAATDIAKMLGVSRATIYRYLSDGGASSINRPSRSTRYGQERRRGYPRSSGTVRFRDHSKRRLDSINAEVAEPPLVAALCLDLPREIDWHRGSIEGDIVNPRQVGD